MNRRAIAAVVVRDLRLVARSRPVMIPLIVVPLILLVLVPGIAALAPSRMAPQELAEIGAILQRMPAEMAGPLAGLPQQEQVLLFLTGYLLAPIYLMVPVMVASVMAANSFAGELERGTMEALLYTPTTDGELVLAKMLAPWLAGVAVAWGGFAAFALVVNAVAWPVMERIFFPTPVWWLLVIWVAPAVAALGLGAAVLVSARVRTVQEAHQMGGIVVLPLVLLVVGQATGLLFFSLPVVALIGAVVWLLDALILRIAIRGFHRGEILARG